MDKKLWTDEERKKLRVALNYTNILTDICNELGFPRYRIIKELKYGLDEVDRKNRIWSRYNPELSVQNQLKEYEEYLRTGQKSK